MSIKMLITELWAPCSGILLLMQVCYQAINLKLITYFYDFKTNMSEFFFLILGFTSDSIAPWLKGNNPEVINVDDELKATHSTLKTFKDLVQIRKTMVAVTAGKTNITVLSAARPDGTVAANSILAYTRTKSGSPGVLVALNPSQEALKVDFSKVPGVAEELTVHAVTKNFANEVLQIK